MKFTYHGDLSPGNSVSFGVREESEIQESGTFEVPDEETALRMVEETPHEPDPADPDVPYRVLQRVASKRDDVSGNLAEPELRAALQGEPLPDDEDADVVEPEDATSNDEDE